MSSCLPAEWAAQSAVLLTWPRPDGDFCDGYAAVEKTFYQIAAAISARQALIISHTRNSPLVDAIAAAGGKATNIQEFSIPSNDVWARDHGPISVIRDGELHHLDFGFNGWGGKFTADLDNQISRALARAGALTAPLETVDFILEGGGIESDGLGSLLTTERCLLAPTRNPTMNRTQIEAQLRTRLGVERILWLAHGDLLGDDTDGHIDTLARFCDPHTIAFQSCEDTADPHYPLLQDMQRELEALRQTDGQPYRLVALPLPRPILDGNGRRLPAGYANFLIINGAVLVPVYGDVADALALERLRPCFPDRELLPIDCRSLIHQYGSLHCVTMQIPASKDIGSSD